MKILLMGAPGSGKGAQGSLIVDKHNIIRISTGDMLRQQIKIGSDIGMLAKKYMGRGELVPDDLIIQLLSERLLQQDASKGFILDGFPRTQSQAVMMTDQDIIPDLILVLDAPDEVIIQRICGRLTHMASGRVYHEQFSPPKVAGIDDLTGEPLIRREDDKFDTVSQRLDTYRRHTYPVVQYYQSIMPEKVVIIDADQPPERVFAAVEPHLHL